MVILSISSELLEYSDKVNDSYVTKYIMKSSKGIEVTLLSYGATLLSLKTVNKDNILEEITLNYNSFDEYKEYSKRYFGCTVGRVANRIKNGQFTLDNKTYNLHVNNGPNSLHGGKEGFDKKNWLSSCELTNDFVKVIFTYTSKDGEENYPGELKVKVTYILDRNNDLFIKYEATTNQNTIVNLTNHTYWNLSGNLSNKIYDHRLLLSCDYYLPTDEYLIPTGELRHVSNVDNSSFNLLPTNSTNQFGKKLGEVIPLVNGGGKPGLDHCYVVNREEHEILPHVATLTDIKSGRQLILHASQPGVQVYTSNWLSEDTKDFRFIQHNAICLETQHFPDSINQPNFPSIILSPHQIYQHTAKFSFRLIE